MSYRLKGLPTSYEELDRLPGGEASRRRRLLGIKEADAAQFFGVFLPKYQNFELGVDPLDRATAIRILQDLRDLCAAAQLSHYAPRLNSPQDMTRLLMRYRNHEFPGQEFYQGE